MGHAGPPYGIPIPDEVHKKYPRNVKRAWVTFDNWWKKAQQEGGPIRRSDMPENVAKAMTTILEAPIPGHDGATGKDSCYMIGVQSQLED